MLRTLWTLISVLAIANLLAVGGFVGWLRISDRLNSERLEKVRQLLAPTISMDVAQAAQQEADRAVAADAAKAAANVGTPPLTAEQRLESGAQRDDTASQHAQRVQRETADLIKTLLRERDELERSQAQFKAQVQAFNDMRARIAKEEGTEQFAKAVSLYQSLKPEQSKTMLQSLVTDGHTDQVVSYLNALPPRIASKIIAEFQKGDAAMAADLLERLRTRGNAVASEGPDAPPPKG